MTSEEKVQEAIAYAERVLTNGFQQTGLFDPLVAAYISARSMKRQGFALNDEEMKVLMRWVLDAQEVKA
jgi:hypothetical protein